MAERVTKTFVWSRALVAAMLATLTARPAAALLTTPVVNLFTGVTVPSPNSAVADFTVATFHGYTAQSISPAGPVNLSPEIIGLVDNVIFIATSGGVIADTVTGYFLSDGATAYYGGERFLESVNFANVGDFLSLDAMLPLPLFQETDQ